MTLAIIDHKYAEWNGIKKLRREHKPYKGTCNVQTAVPVVNSQSTRCSDLHFVALLEQKTPIAALQSWR
ncbi:hypothetical protein BaRGS_00027294, partial [Batillaria attramentaria]